MFYVNINEWSFTTACGETQGAPKPVLWNTEVCSFDATFRNRAGIPVDVTGCTFAAAVDNNFIHTDQLAAYTEDFQILDAQGGIVRFTIQCSSAKFSQLVYAKETTCRMDIYMWPSGSSVREVLLSDKGVVLRPVLETVEGEPEQSSPTYYNKSQIDSLLKACAGAVSTMPTASVDTAGMMYVYTGESSEEYLKGHMYLCIQTQDGYAWQDISPTMEVDSQLDESSSNPVENSVVTQALSQKASTAVATTETAGLMSAQDKSKLEGLVDGYLGYYATSEALLAAHPTGESGQFASVGSTDTIWAWDSDTSSWVNTDTNTVTVSWNNVSDKPNFATVATSGSYTDLSNKPTIPVVDADLSDSSENAIQNKAVTVALSGLMPKTGGTFTGRVYVIVSGGTVIDMGYGGLLIGNGSLSGVVRAAAVGDRVQPGDNDQLCTGRWPETGTYGARVTGGGNSSSRKNIEVLDWSGNLSLSGAVTRAGDQLTALSSLVAIPPRQGVIYTHTLDGTETITLATPGTGGVPTFELWLTQPATAVAPPTWETTIIWDDGTGSFSSANSSPDLSMADTLYAIALRYDGSDWLGNLAYSKAV